MGTRRSRSGRIASLGSQGLSGRGSQSVEEVEVPGSQGLSSRGSRSVEEGDALESD